MGSSTTASGLRSTAMGDTTTASSIASTAMGSNTRASGNYSTAMGYFTIAEGRVSTAIGQGINVTGNNSVGISLSNNSQGAPEFNVSANNVMVIMGGSVGINTTRPTQTLTVVGNLNVTGNTYYGTQSFTNIDAAGNLVVGTNLTVNNSDLFVNSLTGKVGIGTTSPAQKFQVEGNASVEGNFTVRESLSVSEGEVFINSSENASVKLHVKNGTILQTPGSPVIVGVNDSSATLLSIQGFYISGKYAYVVDNEGDSLEIFDISVPTKPKVVGRIQDTSQLNDPFTISVAGKYAYVVSSSNIGASDFTVVDVMSS